MSGPRKSAEEDARLRARRGTACMEAGLPRKIGRESEPGPPMSSDLTASSTRSSDGLGSTVPTRTANIEVGVGQIGRFVVLRKLGEGGMGVVYAAYDDELERKVAIKLLRTEFSGQQQSLGQARLQREAQAMARLSHPNVVQIYEVGKFADAVFIAMEFVAGHNLREWLRQTERPWRTILDAYMQAGRGLMAAHAAGIIHRDFKPKSRRPSQTAPQPTDRPHSHSQGRFERVDVDRAAPGRPGVPHVLAKRWQRAGPPEDQRGHGPRNTCWCVVGPLPIMTDAVQRFTSAVPRRKPCGQ